MKIKLKNLKFNEILIHVRPINLFFVSRYRQAYRNGKDLGKIIINAITKEIVSGNHRVRAMLEEYGPEYVIDVSAKKFKSKADILITFAEENISHGLALSYKSRDSIAKLMLDEGVTPKRTAQIFGVSITKVVEWAGHTVKIEDHTGYEIKIKKAGIENVTKMTKQQYDEHWKKDIGKKCIDLSEQIIRWLKNGWIDTEDKKLMSSLSLMADLIDDLICNEKTAEKSIK